GSRSPAARVSGTSCARCSVSRAGERASGLGAAHAEDRAVHALAAQNVSPPVEGVADGLALRLRGLRHGDGLGIEDVLEGACVRAAQLPHARIRPQQDPRTARVGRAPGGGRVELARRTERADANRGAALTAPEAVHAIDVAEGEYLLGDDEDA